MTNTFAHEGQTVAGSGCVSEVSNGDGTPWEEFLFRLEREAPKGTPMMRKRHLDRHLRIIGVPRRGVAKYSEGPPMMRVATCSYGLRIIGVPFVHLASFRRSFFNACVFNACHFGIQSSFL